MPGSTPTYGLRYLTLSDPPDIAKVGKDLGTDVEGELSRIDGRVDGNDTDITNHDGRISTNEADIADLKKGWNYIASGAATSTTLTIDITAGEKYPTGTFKNLMLRLEGDLDTGNDALVMRINGDSSSIYSRAYARTRLSDGAIVGSEAGTFSGYVVGWWSAFRGNNTIITLFNTDVSSILPVQATGNRTGTNGFDNNREVVHCHGILDSALLVSSLDFFAQTTSVLSDTNWTVEGFRE